MDQVKKFTTNELIMGAGGIAVFLGAFFAWYKAEYNSGIPGIGSGSTSVNGFHYFLQGTIPWILAVALVAVLVLKKLVPSVQIPDLPLPWNQVYLIASGVTAFLILTRIAVKDGTEGFGITISRGFGLYLATLGGIAMVVGAFLKFQAKEEEDAAGGSTPPTSF